jgi:anti-sigma regulatory factor (Ser/Thr protein kinase)
MQVQNFVRSAGEVPAARRFVRDVLTGHPAADDAELLACELVTNSLRHAGDDAAKVTVAVWVSGAVVHVDVIDDGIAGVPRWRDGTGDQEGGRGFLLVNEIAERWGFRPGAGF